MIGGKVIEVRWTPSETLIKCREGNDECNVKAGGVRSVLPGDTIWWHSHHIYWSWGGFEDIQLPKIGYSYSGDLQP